MKLSVTFTRSQPGLMPQAANFMGRDLQYPLSQGPPSRHQTEMRCARILLEDTRASLMSELPMHCI